MYIVWHVLSRFFTFLLNTLSNSSSKNYDEFDAFCVHFTALLIEINNEFKSRIIEKYNKNLDWQNKLQILNNAQKDRIKVSFVRNNKLLFKKKIDDNIFFVFRRICILSTIIKDILIMTHDSNHVNFHRIYEQTILKWYIQKLTKHFKVYLKHCSTCKINQIKRHKLYESLQLILSFLVSFHTLTINFELVLLEAYSDINNIMSIICKFSKRITVISEIDKWNATQWAEIFLQRLDIAD